MIHWGDIGHADQPQRRPTPKITIEREESQKYQTMPIIAKEMRRFSTSKPDISLTKILADAETMARQRSRSFPIIGPDAQYVSENWREMATQTKGALLEPEKDSKITIMNASKSQPNVVSLSANT